MRDNRKNFSRVVLFIGILFILLKFFDNISSFSSLYSILGFYGVIFSLLFDLWMIVPYFLFYFLFYKIKKLNNTSLFTGGILMVLADIYTNYIYFTSADAQTSFIFFVSPIYLIIIAGIGFLVGHTFSRFQNK